MFKTILLVCAILLLLNDVSTKSSNSDTIVLTSVIFRHGDRTPTASFPTDPQINNTYPPYGLGGLTLNGKRRSYRLGQNLRNRYNSLLGSGYSVDLVEVISSAVQRTIMTVQSVLVALFPTDSNDVVAIGQTWQPVYYTYIPTNEDTLIQTWGTCPKILSPAGVYHPTVEEKKLFEYISFHTGVNISSPYDVSMIQDTLQKEEQLGYPLPGWVKPLWPKTMFNISLTAYLMMSDTMLNTTVGNLLNKIAKDTLQKAQGTLEPSGRKMFIYGGHDLNIASLLFALDSHQGELTAYNAHVLFELHLIDGKYGVKVFHKNGEGSNPRQVEVPGCGKFCPVESFVEFANKFKPVVYCA